MADISMPDPQQAVIGGIGCHADFHVAVALDPLGRVLGTEAFPATSAGCRSTRGWLSSFGPVAAGENIDRLGSEASFAHLCAAAPIPAVTGSTTPATAPPTGHCT